MSKVVFNMATNRILSPLRKGKIPWHAPLGNHMNLLSLDPYQGINIFVKSAYSQFREFKSEVWLTQNQAKQLGGEVKPSEMSRGTPTFYWFFPDDKAQPEKNENVSEDLDDEIAPPKSSNQSEEESESLQEDSARGVPLFRYSTAFNAEQVGGIDFKKLAHLKPSKTLFPQNIGRDEAIASCERIVQGGHFGELKQGGSRSVYRRATDSISIADESTFETKEEYFFELFKLAAMSTSHSARLNREELPVFGPQNQEFEMLMADIAASLLANRTGIIHRLSFRENKEYEKHLIELLTANPKYVVIAASKARHAVHWLETGKKIDFKIEAANPNQAKGSRLEISKLLEVTSVTAEAPKSKIDLGLRDEVRPPEGEVSKEELEELIGDLESKLARRISLNNAWKAYQQDGEGLMLKKLGIVESEMEVLEERSQEGAIFTDNELNRMRKHMRLFKDRLAELNLAKTEQGASRDVVEENGEPALVGGASVSLVSDLKPSRGNNSSTPKQKTAEELIEKFNDTDFVKEAEKYSNPIRSDDSNALKLLEGKLAYLNTKQQYMKFVNSAWRGYLKNGDESMLNKVGVRAELVYAKHRATGGKVPYPAWELSNNRQVMAATNQRILELQKRRSAVHSEQEINEVTIVNNTELNRCQMFFPGKPNEAFRAKIKQHGFKWSGRNGAWQRHISDTASLYAKNIAEAFGSSDLEEAKQLKFVMSTSVRGISNGQKLT